MPELLCSALIAAALCLAFAAEGQLPPVVYEESEVPVYTLPDPLVCEDGTPVTDADLWR
ncbi:MAG: acetylxylan esterase, partial [Armatimonadetes bacterium]|nr:acetylxylan esterase [Armatimonadota bacterium]